MAEPFIGEVKAIAFNFAPRGWALCNGQLLQIAQNQALFSILGTTYGGDGITFFALPNLQGRVPVYTGNGIVLGQKGGAQTVTLLSNQAGHTHAAMAATPASTAAPGGNLPGQGSVVFYGANADTTLNPQALTNAGGGQPHSNLQPYLVINFVIALTGIFPSRN